MADASLHAPWTYSPCGDSDGETVGTDHFVLDAAGNEVACPGTEAVARVIAAAPDLLAAAAALEVLYRFGTSLESVRTLATPAKFQQFNDQLLAAYRDLWAAVAKAKG